MVIGRALPRRGVMTRVPRGFSNVDTGRKARRDDGNDSNDTSGQGVRVHQGRGGKEYFFHRSAVYGEGLEDLREGDSVEFDVGEGPKGPRAENVRRTST